ncbi:MAG: DUF6291 domain-containing protein [Candidatus Faecousia sp.]|nr:DUF6291 domain-containing protein [Candidatus Faecousia sp.]
MAKPGVMFYFEIRPCIKRLTLEEKGQLFEAILDYGEFGAIPKVDGAVGVAWDFIQQRLDRDTGRYDERVEQTKYAVAVREAKKKGIQLPPFEKWRLLSDEERERLLSDDNERYPNSTSNSTSNSTTISNSTENKESVADKPPTSYRFSPPSVADVLAYCTENGYHVDPERFVDFYTSNGWRVGKNPMKDWKAAVRSWERKEKANGKTESKPPWTVGTVV